MIYDISQEVKDCAVYPGDTKPVLKTVEKISNGDSCNLTAFSMCAHNGTHVDAPYHFYNEGKKINEVSLDKFIGLALVTNFSGDLKASDAERILNSIDLNNVKKILIKGDATITLEAAKVFAEAKIDLIGNESQTVGPINAPKAVHLELLGAGIILLEGIRLKDVPDGIYTLNAAPLNLGDTDGAPCRAILISND